MGQICSFCSDPSEEAKHQNLLQDPPKMEGNEQGARFSMSWQKACDSREEELLQSKANQHESETTIEALREQTLARIERIMRDDDCFLPEKGKVPAVLWQDRKFVLSLLKINECNVYQQCMSVSVLRHVSDELKSDGEFMIALLRNRGEVAVLRYASQTLLEDPKFILRLSRFCCCAMDYAKDEWKANREFGLAAVKQNCFCFESLAESLRGDKEIALAAIAQNGWSIKYAKESLRGNKTIALAAVTQCGPSIRSLPNSLQKNEEVALAAVKQDGMTLQYVDFSLCSNRQIALAAMSQDRRAARWVGGILSRNDHEVFAHVVSYYPSRLLNASQAIQDDISMITTNFSTLEQVQGYIQDTQANSAAFMAFLGCIHTGNAQDNPCCYISVEKLGDETSLGLKQHIAEYVGFLFGDVLASLRVVKRTAPILEGYSAAYNPDRFREPWNGLTNAFFPTLR